MIWDNMKSADPCRQQGERVRGGLTSNKMQEGAKRELWTDDAGHGVWALRGGPLTGAAPDESQLSDNAGKLAVGSAGTQVKSRFGASF